MALRAKTSKQTEELDYESDGSDDRQSEDTNTVCAVRTRSRTKQPVMDKLLDDHEANTVSRIFLDFMKAQTVQAQEAERERRKEQDERDARFREEQDEREKVREERANAQQEALLKLQAKLQAEEEDKRRDKNYTRRKKDDLMRTFARMGEAEDLEDYMESLQRQLIRCAIPQEEWVDQVCANMSSRYRELASSLQQTHGGDFLTVRKKLLAAGGFTQQAAAREAFRMKNADIASLPAPQILSKLRKLANRLLQHATSVEECKFAVAVAVLHNVLPKKATMELDMRKAQSYEDICDILHDYIEREGSVAMYNPYTPTFRKPDQS